MFARLVSVLLVTFLASLGLAGPDLPLNARLSDLLFLGVLAAVASIPRPHLGWHRLDLLVAVYLVGALPSFLATSSAAASAIELVRQGYLAVIYAAVALAVGGGYLRSVAWGLALCGAIPAIAGLAFLAAQASVGLSTPGAGDVMALPYVGTVLRLRGFAVSESMLACVLAMAAPVAIGLAANGSTARARAWWAAAAGSIVVAAPLTFSHSVAGVAVAVVLGAWPYAEKFPRWRAVAVAAAATVVLLLNVAATASVRRVVVGGQSIADETSYHYGMGDERLHVGGVTIDYSVMSYFRLKQVAWAAFMAQPLTGVGLDRFHEVSERAFAEGRLSSTYRAIDPHSTLTGRLAETGIIGGVTLLLLWAGAAGVALDVSHRPAPDRWIAAAVAAGLAGALINSLNVDIMNFRFAWVGLGVLRGLAHTARSVEPTES